MKCALCRKKIGLVLLNHLEESKDYPVVIENETFHIRCHEQCWTEHVKRILKRRETELEVKA